MCTHGRAREHAHRRMCDGMKHTQYQDLQLLDFWYSGTLFSCRTVTACCHIPTHENLLQQDPMQTVVSKQRLNLTNHLVKLIQHQRISVATFDALFPPASCCKRPPRTFSTWVTVGSTLYKLTLKLGKNDANRYFLLAALELEHTAFPLLVGCRIRAMQLKTTTSWGCQC